MINTASQTIGGNEFLISGLETTRESHGGKGGEKNTSNFHTKWISDLNVKKKKKKKLLDPSINKFLNELWVRKTFLTKTQNSEAVRANADIFDYILQI